MQRNEKKRLSVDLPLNLHIEIKLAAARYNCSITKWILKAIADRLKKEYN
jgi:predicted HicB family RNase H-like nuclease